MHAAALSPFSFARSLQLRLPTLPAASALVLFTLDNPPAFDYYKDEHVHKRRCINAKDDRRAAGAADL